MINEIGGYIRSASIRKSNVHGGGGYGGPR